MDTSKIQLVFKETKTLLKIIETSYLTSSNKLFDKIKAYLDIKAQQIINYHNPNLEFNINNININSNTNIFIFDYLPRYVFMVAYTLSNINHPYIIYFNMDDIFINVLIPIGKDYQQANTEDYINVISSITPFKPKKCSSKQTKKSVTKINTIIMNENNKVLLTAIHVLLINTIKTRTHGIIYSKFSILTCENMVLCKNKLIEIINMDIEDSEKHELYIKIQDYYRNLGIKLLQTYFTLLRSKDYIKAYDFLHGGHYKFNEYYGKTRLNTFFKNNKNNNNIIGHLEVFISLYKLLYMNIEKLSFFAVK